MQPPKSPEPVSLPSLRSVFSFRTLVHAVFWSWHAVWMIAVLFGLAAQLLPFLLAAAFEGQIPWDIALCAVALLVLPGFTFFAGWRLHADHHALFGLFYGVAGVGFTLLVARIFLIRELTGSVVLMLVTLAAGAAFFAADLFGRRAARGLAAEVVTLVGHTALLLVGVWVGLTIGMLCLPALAMFVRGLPEAAVEIFSNPSDWPSLAQLPMVFALLGFGACCMTVVLALPFALAWLYPRAWWRQLQRWRARRSLASGLAVSAATVVIWFGVLACLDRQPQHDAFERLARPPADLEAQADNLAEAESIRAGLLNATLAPYRYWGADGNAREVARMYEHAFGLADGDGPQSVFELLARPLLYQGDALDADRRHAEVLYERFFDRPLQDGDREAVVTAMTATWDRSDVEAGLLDVGNRNVLLAEQELTRSLDGDIARFELHEVYRNQTHEPQEVFYYFDLPERAAITGLWLGDSDDRERRFRYTVAPRGAAQAVYREQRRQRIDPALLEQVGPRQYRMRVFPVPALGRAPDTMHLWLEWSVLADAGGGWPLPRLVEARNVYWDDETRRSIDGASSRHDGWLPTRIDGRARQLVHELAIDGYTVRATPSDATPTVIPGRLAVVVDTSLSMAAYAEDVHSTLEQLAARGYAFDVYVAPSPWSAERPRRVELAELDLHFYGGHSHVGVLADFARVRERDDHAAVIVLSDRGSFAFLQDETPDPRGDHTGAALSAATRVRGELEQLQAAHWDQPIWMLHFGGLPHAYRDELTDLLRRTHGGVATELDTLLLRLTTDVVDGYAWSIAPAPVDASDARDDAFAPIAAAALVGELAGRGTDLDAVHAIAKQYAVVTAWSSMIVLVDDAQREALRKASEAEDRFDREAESGVEVTSTPDAALDVDATPEPHEWMLLALALLGLVVVARTKPQPSLC